MSNADLRDVKFRGAILKGADLRMSSNLTHMQVNEAIVIKVRLCPTIF